MSNNISVSTGGTSQSLAVSAASATTTVPFAAGTCIVSPTVDMFVRRGVTPVAVADGTDQILLAGFTYRIAGIMPNEKLAFIAASAGTAYITPGV